MPIASGVAAEKLQAMGTDMTADEFQQLAELYEVGLDLEPEDHLNFALGCHGCMAAKPGSLFREEHHVQAASDALKIVTAYQMARGDVISPEVSDALTEYKNNLVSQYPQLSETLDAINAEIAEAREEIQSILSNDGFKSPEERQAAIDEADKMRNPIQVMEANLEHEDEKRQDEEREEAAMDAYGTNVIHTVEANGDSYQFLADQQLTQEVITELQVSRESLENVAFKLNEGMDLTEQEMSLHQKVEHAKDNMVNREQDIKQEIQQRQELSLIHI